VYLILVRDRASAGSINLGFVCLFREGQDCYVSNICTFVSH
jgi:hypothetical protein